MRQVIVDFGQLGSFPLRVYGYGLMLVMGFLLSIYLARWRARRFGENPDYITSIGLLALVGGVAGARGAFIIEKWNTLFRYQSLSTLLDITSGGLIYYGGVAVAMACIIVFLLVKRLPARRYLDILAPSLMLGLAFGRMGCLLNGCCYGGPARDDFALAMKFPYATPPLLNLSSSPNIFAGASVSPAFAEQVAKGALPVPDWLLERSGPAGEAGEERLKRPAELTPAQAREAQRLSSLPVLPSQALDIFSSLLLMGILLAYTRLRGREGQVFALMLVLYPITRFILESIRGDNVHDLLSGRLTHNQYSSMGMLLGGVVMFAALRKWNHSDGPFAVERQGGSKPSGISKP